MNALCDSGRPQTLVSGEQEGLEVRVAALPMVHQAVCVDLGQFEVGMSRKRKRKHCILPRNGLT